MRVVSRRNLKLDSRTLLDADRRRIELVFLRSDFYDLHVLRRIRRQIRRVGDEAPGPDDYTTAELLQIIKSR